ncbi:MAG TPA: helix-turn-helix domain-containing protein [Frateuria sp.]|uniref:helix-turn-helix domain-containing protein n=1 Tax=Frateuria sp. TaxID=2211372 RepID=UPI002D7E5311|nr:helix-turn-helix domain-containing protein [Frateuria sp.]HET6805344.1 helix-turn-helix domain-containing protein [Frateuria sp.]
MTWQIECGVEPCAMPSRPSPYQEFAERLQLAFDRTTIKRGRGRVSEVASHYQVSRETARLWFAGSAMPELPRLIQIARDCDVALEWLATGRGSMTPPHAGVRDEGRPYMASLSEDEQAVVTAMRLLHPHRRRGLVALLT